MSDLAEQARQHEERKAAVKAKEREARKRVTIGGVVVDRKDVCRECGDDIVRTTGGDWLHVPRLKGERYYQHEARPGGKR